MNATLMIQAAGVMLVGLAVIGFFLPGRFNWREEMGRLSLLNRQIFTVHSWFIIGILFFFAAIALLAAPALLEPGALPRVVLAGLTLFWLARLLIQWLVYDHSLWRGKRFETVMHVLFTGLWVYFTAAFGYALWLNLRGG